MENLPIITVLAIVIAIYAVLPKYRQNRVYYAFGRLEKISGIIFIIDFLILWILSIYWSNLNEIKSVEILNLILVGLVTGYFLNIFFREHAIRNEDKFIDKFKDLVQNKDYYTVIMILESEYNYIFIKNGENSLFNKIKLSFLEYSFINQIAKLRPYFGLKIILENGINLNDRIRFTEHFFTALFRDVNSVLYTEMRNIENIDYRYKISEENKITYGIFKDINVCDELKIYSGAYNVLTERLNESVKEYNSQNTRYYEGSNHANNNPVYVGLKFYDIMITEALYQGLKWHINLYDYFNFIDIICENYYSIEGNFEISTPYSFFLDQILRNLNNTIFLIKQRSRKIKPNLPELLNEYCSHENDNIVKSSIICLDLCMKKVIDSNNIPFKIKKEQTELYLHLLYSLTLNEDKFLKSYGNVLQKCFERLAEISSVKRIVCHLFNPINILDWIKDEKKIEKTNEIKKMLEC